MYCNRAVFKLRETDMAKKEINLTAEKVRKRERRLRTLRLILLVILILLILFYIILKLIYEVGNFTVTLDTSANIEESLVIYENINEKLCLTTLTADKLDFMTNITESWIPKNIHNGPGGSNNGQNYIAYTFYAENQGEEVINYWRTIEVDEVIKGADEAIRVKVIKDGVETVYAKPNKRTGQAEPGTVPFPSNEVAVLEQEKDFKPGEIHKYTIIIWLEGNDPECIDDIIGGEVKMHMELSEEHIDQEQ